MRFGWDEAKAAVNLEIHGISFNESVEAFFEPNAIEVFDSEHSPTKTAFTSWDFQVGDCFTSFTPKDLREI